MDISLTRIDLQFNESAGHSETGPAIVGWLLVKDTTAVIYDPPERLSTQGQDRSHGKSASRCPAILNMESRYFVIKCPFDIHVGFERTHDGKPVIKNKAGSGSSIRSSRLGEKLHMVNEAEWRFKNVPTIQLSLPYLFIADEPVYITQLAAFAHYRATPLPGTIFGGRFPIHTWPRPMIWAFEWHDTTKDLVLKRGDPLFYCQFEAGSPDRPVKLIEARMTDALANYMEKISGAVNYVNQTFNLFKAAERIRPETLVEKV
jgi:hypothetical protein